MFKLGVITDEVSQDFESALQFAKKHDLDCVELRSAWEKGPFEFTDEDIRKIKEISSRYGIPVISVASPFFKCSYFDEEMKREHLRGFERVVEYAGVLGAKYIRVFDFLRDPQVTKEKIAQAYAYPIRLCEKHGLTLLLESEPVANSYDCQTVSETVRYLDTSTVRALYEPGNDLYADTAEIPYPDGFGFVRDLFVHVHVKDAVRVDGKAVGVAVGKGWVDYHGIMKELLRIGYDGAVMLETHYKPNCAIPEEVLRNPKGSQISIMGEIASEECIIALKEIIAKAGKEV